MSLLISYCSFSVAVTARMVGSKIKSHFDLNYHNLKDKSLQLATDASEPAKEVERDLGHRKPPLPRQ